MLPLLINYSIKSTVIPLRKKMFLNLVSYSIKHPSTERCQEATLCSRSNKMNFITAVRDNIIGKNSGHINCIFDKHTGLQTYVSNKSGDTIELYNVKPLLKRINGGNTVQSKEAKSAGMTVLQKKGIH